MLLYVLMSQVALPRIGSILADRSKRIGDDLGGGRALEGQSDAANAAYEKALADARARAQGIASSTREQQAARPRRPRSGSKRGCNERLAAAEQSIAATRTAAMGNVRAIAADTASAIVERLIGKAPADQEVAAALGDVLKR